MKIKEVEKLISACEVDFEELKENAFRNSSNAKEDDYADINAMLIQRIRKNIKGVITNESISSIFKICA